MFNNPFGGGGRGRGRDEDAQPTGVNAFFAQLQAKMEEAAKEPEPLTPEQKRELAGKLQAAAKAFLAQHQFSTGQLVAWKSDMRNRRWPAYKEPMVVIEHLATPVYDGNNDSASQYFREPLDLLLGRLDADGELDVRYYDSRRFQPWTEE